MDDRFVQCIICGSQSAVVADKVLRILAGLTIVGINAFTLIAVYRVVSGKYEVRLLYCHMTFANLLMGTAVVYHSSVFDIWTLLTLECRIRLGFILYLRKVSLLYIMVLSLDAIITVSRPMLLFRLKKKKLLSVFAFIWVFPLITTTTAIEMVSPNATMCSVMRFNSRPTFIILFIVGLVPVIITAFCELVIFVIAIFQVKHIAPYINTSMNFNRLLRLNKRAAITAVFIVTPFLIFTTPILGGYLHLAIYPEERDSASYTKAIRIQIFLDMIGSAIQPIVFIFRLRSVRNEIKKMIFIPCRGKVVAQLPTEEKTTTMVWTSSVSRVRGGKEGSGFHLPSVQRSENTEAALIS